MNSVSKPGAGGPFPFTSISQRNLPPRANAADRDLPAGEQPTVSHMGYGLAGRESEFYDIFDAALSGVHHGFNHLSKTDIAHPPHEWFDAALARQITYHLMVERYGIPKRKIVKELQRTRDAMQRAMRNVEDRLMGPDFAKSYAEMAARADAALQRARDEE